MSIIWMAFVAGLIAIEKTLPWRRTATYATAAVLLVLGVLILASPHAIPWLTVPGEQPMQMTGLTAGRALRVLAPDCRHVAVVAYRGAGTRPATHRRDGRYVVAVSGLGPVVDWHVRGSYFEACNCEAICPCRSVGGRPGGPSSFGECFGTLSWHIHDGRADGIDLSGLRTVMSLRYSTGSSRAPPGRSSSTSTKALTPDNAPRSPTSSSAGPAARSPAVRTSHRRGPRRAPGPDHPRAHHASQTHRRRRLPDGRGRREASEPGDVRCGIPASTTPAPNCTATRCSRPTRHCAGKCGDAARRLRHRLRLPLRHLKRGVVEMVGELAMTRTRARRRTR